MNSPRSRRYVLCVLISLWQIMMYACAFLFLSGFQTCLTFYMKFLLDPYFLGNFSVYVFGLAFSVSQIRMELIELRL